VEPSSLGETRQNERTESACTVVEFTYRRLGRDLSGLERRRYVRLAGKQDLSLSGKEDEGRCQ
jgi:hypothetical protein